MRKTISSWLLSSLLLSVYSQTLWGAPVAPTANVAEGGDLPDAPAIRESVRIGFHGAKSGGVLIPGMTMRLVPALGRGLPPQRGSRFPALRMNATRGMATTTTTTSTSAGNAAMWRDVAIGVGAAAMIAGTIWAIKHH